MSANPSKHACAAALVFAMSQIALASAQAPVSPDAAGYAEFWCNTSDSASPCNGPLLEATRISGDTISQTKEAGGQWGRVVGQILLFTAAQHGVRLTEKKTRRELGGPWFGDWFNSAASLFIEPTWSDGGGSFTNYVAHPMAGSVYAYIYRQNHPSDLRMRFDSGGEYVAHLVKASTVSAFSSLQFELGPLSESSLGNVGIPPNRQKMAWVDIVVTPALGAVWMAAEDALDRYVIERLEPKIDNAALENLIRIILNPTRSMANVVALEKPWKRHGRP